MHTLRTVIASTAAIASAALVIPVLAQTVDDDAATESTSSMSDATVEIDTPSSYTDEASTSSDDGVLTDEAGAAADDDAAGGTTGTGTIPSELPDTGGGWGAGRR